MSTMRGYKHIILLRRRGPESYVCGYIYFRMLKPKSLGIETKVYE
jgi:hypothetical protein